MGKLLNCRDAEEPFAAALLQDMAIPILAKEVPDMYLGLLEIRNQRQVRLSAVESEVLGWSHADAAGMIARQWKLPEEFAVLVEGHLAVDCWAGQAEKSRQDGRGPFGPAPLDLRSGVARTCPVRELLRSGGAGGSLPATAVLAQVDRELASLPRLLKLANPAKTLLGRYQEAAATH